jgi:hypothetical protein
MKLLASTRKKSNNLHLPVRMRGKLEVAFDSTQEINRHDNDSLAFRRKADLYLKMSCYVIMDFLPFRLHLEKSSLFFGP